MKTRLASVADARHLAHIHRLSSSGQPGGFMFKLGEAFLTRYYRVFLGEKNNVILCAEDIKGKILGFVSGTLDAKEHAEALRRNRLWLLIGAIPAIIKSPRLIAEMRSRERSLSGDHQEKGYIVLEGARLEYWGWLPDQRSKMGAVTLLQKCLKIMHLLGARNIRHEVDQINEKSIKMHLLLGSRVVGEFVTKDGRKRLIMEYSFSDDPLKN